MDSRMDIGNVESKDTLLLAAALSLFVGFVFLAGLRLCATYCSLSGRFWGPLRYFEYQPRQDEKLNCGLDASVIENLPNFIFKRGSRKLDDRENIECSVCLEEFQDGEKGRILPTCGHCFHADCVEMWFFSHITCPLCRTAVTSSLESVPASQAADSPDSTTTGDSPQNYSHLSGFSHRMGASPSSTSEEPSEPYVDLELGENGGGPQISEKAGRQFQEDGRSAVHITSTGCNNSLEGLAE